MAVNPILQSPSTKTLPLGSCLKLRSVTGPSKTLPWWSSKDVVLAGISAACLHCPRKVPRPVAREGSHRHRSQGKFNGFRTVGKKPRIKIPGKGAPTWSEEDVAAWETRESEAAQEEVEEEDAEEASDPAATAEKFEGLDMTELERPALYVVATPIGNVSDITLRALEILRGADVIYAEDTQVTGMLLRALDVPLNGRPLHICQKSNESQASMHIVRHLREGKCVALVSDAGTPLLSDPGLLVLQRVREEIGDCPIRPIPGPCAAVAALSAAGVCSTSFIFGGFLPDQGGKRQQLQLLLRKARSGLPSTLILYEAPHRILDTLEMIADELEDSEQKVAVCRELTKRFETILQGRAKDVLQEVTEDPNNQKGKFVILVDAQSTPTPEREVKAEGGQLSSREVMKLLQLDLPRSRAAFFAAKICGVSKSELQAPVARNS